MSSKNQTKTVLIQLFSRDHVDAVLRYFEEAIRKYRENDWEGVALKSGKFIEAVTKSLLIYCNQSIPRARVFKASNLLKSLEQLSPNSYHDTIRIAIPRLCLFVYEIANNRGGRHYADDIDANEMDAKVIIPAMSWILAEMVRFAGAGSPNPAYASNLIETITEKIYPFFEDIDGRAYINLDNLSAKEIAVLLLYYKYPHRISRQDLIDAVVRHGSTKGAAHTAVYRMKNLVDTEGEMWRLRGLGRQKAEELLKNYT